MEGYRSYSRYNSNHYTTYYDLSTSPCRPGFKYGKDVGVNPGDPREMKCIEFRGDPVTGIETLDHMNHRLQNKPTEPSISPGIAISGAMWAFGGLLVIIAAVLLYRLEYNSAMLILLIIGLLIIGGGLGVYYGYTVNDQKEREQRYEMDRALYDSRVEPPKWEPIE